MILSIPQSLSEFTHQKAALGLHLHLLHPWHARLTRFPHRYWPCEAFHDALWVDTLW